MSAASSLSAALTLAEEYGIPVFPCRAREEHINGELYKAKSPYTTHGFADATTNIEQIAQWWERWPDALVGVPTGAATKLVVIDVDPDGAPWYQENAQRLACGRIHKTPRGHHLLYRMPTGVAEIRNSAGKIAPGVDVRGEGGYIIWWPAHGSEVVGDMADLAEPPALDALAAPKVNGADHSNAAPARHLVREGRRNDYLSREAYRLRKTGSTVEQIVAILQAVNQARCTPPLPESEVRQIAGGKEQIEAEQDEQPQVTVDDFRAYLPTHQYIFQPSRELWPGSSVNARCAPPQENGQTLTKQVPRKAKGGITTFETVPLSPTEYLDERRAVEQMTWAPGEATIIADRLVDGGGWIDRPGCNTFNLYRPPNLQHGDPTLADPWLEHVNKVFPDDGRHIIRWLAHRVQRPGEKINHALMLGGAPGIGKDATLTPIKYAIGPWNFAEVSPAHLLGRFNPFIKSVILRVSEARDLGDVDRYSFYEHTKVYTAAPPDVLQCDEKNLREHAVMNVTGVIITSNHKSDGIYLPADDRRHYVAWSDRSISDFTASYWNTLWTWYYEHDGTSHVAACLKALDLTGFDPKAPPPKTPAFWDIVDANRAPEDAEMADVIDKMGNKDAITITEIALYASDAFREWIEDRRNSRQIPHRLESAGYTSVRNTAAKDGLWKVNGKRQVIYGRLELSVRDRFAAAARLSSGR